jgi:hypothetical protein
MIVNLVGKTCYCYKLAMIHMRLCVIKLLLHCSCVFAENNLDNLCFY